MALTRLEKDMNIIQKLGDEPNDVDGLSSAELKAKFDEGNNAMKKWVNETFIPEVEKALSDAKEFEHTTAEIDAAVDRVERGYTAEDVGAAPAGYGLGGSAKNIDITSADEINDITANGWYHISCSTELTICGVTFTKALLHTYQYGTAERVQKLYPRYKFIELVRYSTGINTWGVWEANLTSKGGTLTGDLLFSKNGVTEYLTPPMQIGVEYRTTERFNGKPVYAKLVDCGAPPINSVKNSYAGTVGANAVFRANGTVGGTNLATGGFNLHARVANTNGEILIQTRTTSDTGITDPIYAAVYYTKSTD